VKLQLFYSKREILYFLLILLGILSINLGVKFYEFKEFRAKNYAFYDAQILNAAELSNAQLLVRAKKLKFGEGKFYNPNFLLADEIALFITQSSQSGR